MTEATGSSAQSVVRVNKQGAERAPTARDSFGEHASARIFSTETLFLAFSGRFIDNLKATHR